MKVMISFTSRHLSQVIFGGFSLRFHVHYFSRYGYLTWEWKAGIRSYIYPLIFTTMYRVLYVLNIDYAVLLVSI